MCNRQIHTDRQLFFYYIDFIFFKQVFGLRRRQQRLRGAVVRARQRRVHPRIGLLPQDGVTRGHGSEIRPPEHEQDSDHHAQPQLSRRSAGHSVSQFKPEHFELNERHCCIFTAHDKGKNYSIESCCRITLI